LGNTASNILTFIGYTIYIVGIVAYWFLKLIFWCFVAVIVGITFGWLLGSWLD